MNYPDLIYAGEKPSFCANPDIFEDMKLNSMIREDVSEVMRHFCAADDIRARHEIFRSLDDNKTFDYFRELASEAGRMDSLDSAYSESRNEAERHYIFLMLMHSVCAFIRLAAQNNGCGTLYDRFHKCFVEYSSTSIFAELSSKADELYKELININANVFHIDGEHLKISRGNEETFATIIRRCASELGIEELPTDKKTDRRLSTDTITALKSLYPAQFGELAEYFKNYKVQYSSEICKYRVQLDFYIQIKLLINKIMTFGIPVSYPQIVDERIIDIKNAYDITLLTKEERNIIPNDVFFNDSEPFYYLTGANGGGKTTYLRTVGIALVLALTGCPVPCQSARIHPMKRLFTHFPRDERFDNTGRFVDEEKRINEMLSVADNESVVLLNETYSTTNEETASILTAKLAQTLWSRGAYGIYITHQHGLDSGDIPYLNVVIDSDDNNRRTYKVSKRKEREGSFAKDILMKYGLTAEALSEKFGVT